MTKDDVLAAAKAKDAASARRRSLPPHAKAPRRPRPHLPLQRRLRPPPASARKSASR